jgi:hypothetical protein
MLLEAEAHEVLDLTLELWHAEQLSWSEALATARRQLGDLQRYAAEWDISAGYMAMPEGDTLAADGLRA